MKYNKVSYVGEIIMSEKVMQKISITENVISLEYILVMRTIGNSDVYSIEIIEINSDGKKRCRLNDVARSEEKALSLLHLLSANAVCPASAPYVIDDLADSVTFC